MTDIAGTTKVSIELCGRKATIADVRAALDTLEREGIPETFEVDLYQREERVDTDTSIPYSERPRTHRLSVEAKRAAR